MNYQEKYQQAKQAGYTDQEIMEYLGTKDAAFEEKMSDAKQAGYTPQEVLNYFNESPAKEKFGIGDYAKDFATQGAQGLGIGLLGTYGDILDLLGLQSRDSLTPGQEAQYSLQHDILTKMQEPGYKPSFSDIHALSDEDDIAPRFSRLPNSQDIERIGKELGLVSEPKTPAARYARRIGRIGGGGISLGSGAIIAPIVAGAAGQTLEELGAPAWAQAAAEIVASLKFSAKTNVPVTSKSKEVEKVIKDLRKVGYSEQDITLAKSALEKRKILKKFASLTPKAENAIQQGVKNSEELFKEQIKKGLPGYAEGGLPYLQKQANGVYNAMEELASSVSIKNKEPFKKAIQDSINYMEKSVLLPKEKEFIGFLQEGLQKVNSSDTADFMTSFYRKLGQSGNWSDPKTKEHLLKVVKDGIKQSFSESGPEAARFGKYFEQTNEAWKHWLKTKDLMEVIEKTQSVEGTSFKKLASILDKPENHELAKTVLGPEQLNNIRTITKGAGDIESLLKQFPAHQKVILGIEAASAIYYVITGDYKKAGAIIGIEAARRLGTRMLINPKTQNTVKRIITAAKNNSPKHAAILAQELVEEPDQNSKSNNNL
jgi:hypothetical protein